MRIVSLLAFSVALLTGCVGPRQLAPPPPAEQTPVALNSALEGLHVTVELWSGGAYQHAAEVHIAGDSLFLTSNRMRQARQSVLLAEVRRISYIRDRKANKGALIGAVPGLLFIGTGLLATLADDSNSLVTGEFIVRMGVGFLAIGSTIGALIGQWSAPGERVIVYESSLRTGGSDSELAQPTPPAERDAQSP